MYDLGALIGRCVGTGKPARRAVIRRARGEAAQALRTLERRSGPSHHGGADLTTCFTAEAIGESLSTLSSEGV